MAQFAKCRVCGKEYTPCKSAKYDPKVFNWREVACTPDCGQVYLEQIIASRTPAETVKPKRTSKRKPVKVSFDDIAVDAEINE